MRQHKQKYTNAMLTINAILLSAVVWTQVADSPMLDQSAEAQVRVKTVEPMFPNAAQQRAEMLRVLQKMQGSMEAQTAALNSGKLKVEVTNLSDLLIDAG